MTRMLQYASKTVRREGVRGSTDAGTARGNRHVVLDAGKSFFSCDTLQFMQARWFAHVWVDLNVVANYFLALFLGVWKKPLV